MKQYNGEKAIISLTSWKARINTVSKTLYSLIQQCPGFHIVLCLSEEEFPQKEAELPDDLMLFVENDLIEILWVYKNYKSFKKVLFTMYKYRDVPVISADDDCIYNCNYAQELYDIWTNNKNKIITYDLKPKVKKDFLWCRGPATIYPPNIFSNVVKVLDKIYNNNFIDDDAFICALRMAKNIKMDYTNKSFWDICKFHTIENSQSSKKMYNPIKDISHFLPKLIELHKLDVI